MKKKQTLKKNKFVKRSKNREKNIPSDKTKKKKVIRGKHGSDGQRRVFSKKHSGKKKDVTDDKTLKKIRYKTKEKTLKKKKYKGGKKRTLKKSKRMTGGAGFAKLVAEQFNDQPDSTTNDYNKISEYLKFHEGEILRILQVLGNGESNDDSYYKSLQVFILLTSLIKNGKFYIPSPAAAEPAVEGGGYLFRGGGEETRTKKNLIGKIAKALNINVDMASKVLDEIYSAEKFTASYKEAKKSKGKGKGNTSDKMFEGINTGENLNEALVKVIAKETEEIFRQLRDMGFVNELADLRTDIKDRLITGDTVTKIVKDYSEAFQEQKTSTGEVTQADEEIVTILIGEGHEKGDAQAALMQENNDLANARQILQQQSESIQSSPGDASLVLGEPTNRNLPYGNGEKYTLSGIGNPGNFCYRNAVMTAVLNQEDIMEEIMKAYNTLAGEDATLREKFLTQVVKGYYQKNELADGSNAKSFNELLIIYATEIMNAGNDDGDTRAAIAPLATMDNTGQHDANEFFPGFVCALEKALGKPTPFALNVFRGLFCPYNILWADKREKYKVLKDYNPATEDKVTPTQNQIAPPPDEDDYITLTTDQILYAKSSPYKGFYKGYVIGTTEEGLFPNTSVIEISDGEWVDTKTIYEAAKMNHDTMPHGTNNDPLNSGYLLSDTTSLHEDDRSIGKMLNMRQIHPTSMRNPGEKEEGVDLKEWMATMYAGSHEHHEVCKGVQSSNEEISEDPMHWELPYMITDNKPPALLAVGIGRNVGTGGKDKYDKTPIKIDQEVCFGIQADKSPIMDQNGAIALNDAKAAKSKYTLTAVVLYRGGEYIPSGGTKTETSGHYISLVKIDNEWFCLNDSYVFGPLNNDLISEQLETGVFENTLCKDIKNFFPVTCIYKWTDGPAQTKFADFSYHSELGPAPEPEPPSEPEPVEPEPDPVIPKPVIPTAPEPKPVIPPPPATTQAPLPKGPKSRTPTSTKMIIKTLDLGDSINVDPDDLLKTNPTDFLKFYAQLLYPPSSKGGGAVSMNKAQLKDALKSQTLFKVMEVIDEKEHQLEKLIKDGLFAFVGETGESLLEIDGEDDEDVVTKKNKFLKMLISYGYVPSGMRTGLSTYISESDNRTKTGEIIALLKQEEFKEGCHLTLKGEGTDITPCILQQIVDDGTLIVSNIDLDLGARMESAVASLSETIKGYDPGTIKGYDPVDIIAVELTVVKIKDEKEPDEIPNMKHVINVECSNNIDAFKIAVGRVLIKENKMGENGAIAHVVRFDEDFGEWVEVADSDDLKTIGGKEIQVITVDEKKIGGAPESEDSEDSEDKPDTEMITSVIDIADVKEVREGVGKGLRHAKFKSMSKTMDQIAKLASLDLLKTDFEEKQKSIERQIMEMMGKSHKASMVLREKKLSEGQELLALISITEKEVAQAKAQIEQIGQVNTQEKAKRIEDYKKSTLNHEKMLKLVTKAEEAHENIARITEAEQSATTAILKNTDATLVVISGGMIGKFIDHFQRSTFDLLKTKDTGGQYSEDFYEMLKSPEFKEYVSEENYLDLKTKDLIRWAQENKVNSFTSEAEGKDIVKPAPEAAPAPVAAPAEAKPAPVAAPSPVAAAATADAAAAASAATADAAAAAAAAATPAATPEKLTGKETKAAGKAADKQKKATDKEAKKADKAAKKVAKKAKKNVGKMDPGAPATPVAAPAPVAATPVGGKTVKLSVTFLKDGKQVLGEQKIDVFWIYFTTYKQELDYFKKAVAEALKVDLLNNNDTVGDITYYDEDLGWCEVDSQFLSVIKDETKDETKNETKIQVAYTSK
jgi:hypothetical protein